MSLGGKVILSSYLRLYCKLLLTRTNVSSFSNEWIEINKIIKSFSYSHILECIQLIKEVTNKTMVKKQEQTNKNRETFKTVEE